MILQPGVASKNDLRASLVEPGKTPLKNLVPRSSGVCGGRVARCEGRADAIDDRRRCRLTEEHHQTGLLEPGWHGRMSATLCTAEIRHHINAAPHDRADEIPIHFPVAHEMRQTVYACLHQPDRIVMVKDVRVDLESAAVPFVDDRAVNRRRHARRASAAIVYPDLDEVDTLGRQLAHRSSTLLRGGHFVGDSLVCR